MNFHIFDTQKEKIVVRCNISLPKIGKSFKLEEHISTKIKKVSFKVGLIRRKLSYVNGPIIKKLFTVLVRSRLVYGQVLGLFR